jgi:hypothetical protein
MSAGEKKSKAKLARHVEDIEAVFERRDKIGSSLTAAQRAFLEEVAFRDLLWYRYGYHAQKDVQALPAGMDHTHRQTKAAVLAKLRGELSDLALLAEVSAPNLEDVRRSVPKGGHTKLRPWISKLDILEVLDIEDICKVIGFAVEVFGEDYAAALMHTIESYGRSRKSKGPKADRAGESGQ